MAAVIEHPAEGTDQLQRQALEHLLESLVSEIAQLVDSAEYADGLGTREAALQLEVFDERRQRALAYLAEDLQEPDCIRVGNLERLVDALRCSREFFGGPGAARTEPPLSAPCAPDPR